MTPVFLPPQAGVADEMFRSIPERARAMILNGEFQGHGMDLVTVQSEVHRPSFRETGLSTMQFDGLMAHTHSEHHI